jgi:hypothetical protein
MNMGFVPVEAAGSRVDVLYQKLVIEKITFAIDMKCLTLQNNF